MRMSWLFQALALGAALGVGAALPGTFAAADAPKPRVAQFDEISVHRLNIVEPNGRYRLVLANAARFPGLFMNGQEYRHHSRNSGGMLFFNDDGDEVGGLGLHSGPDGTASSSLMFDQYKQDQTVGIEYDQAHGERQAGLRVWDRPDYPILPLFEMSDRAARAATPAERDRIRAEMIAYGKAHGGFGAERLFAGKRHQDALVQLADPQGRPRLVLRVGADGQPRIDFLDTQGHVTRSISQ